VLKSLPQIASSPRIEQNLPEDMGQRDLASLTSIHGTHQGQRPGAAPTGRTHDRKRSSMQKTAKILASGAIHTCPRAGQ